MPLDPEWSRNDLADPFADNSTGAITAQTLRNFASHLAVEGTAADWYTVTSGTITPGIYTGWTTNDAVIDIWLNGDVTATTARSTGWTLSTDPTDNEHLIGYYNRLPEPITAALPERLVYISIFGEDGNAPEIDFTDVTDNTKVAPIVAFHDGTDFAVGTPVVFNAGRSGTWSSGNPLDLTGTQLLRFPDDKPYVKVGFRLTPPAGSPIQEAGTPVTIDVTTMRTMVVARTASAEV